ncbi:aspartate aminotransferase family protein [Acidiplasma aeolicum]|jgi:4-aminobutyrate aminotransferase|uniref:aspartate aminotransferase family protein n=1 Tax=Acidiplasma aeolicum TaxID=507754 RepID=UPI00371E1FB2
MEVYNLSYDEAPVIKTELPGPRSRIALNEQDMLETQSRTYTRAFKLAVDNARGSTVMDLDGNIFIDWFAGISVLNLGHNNPIVRHAIEEQLEKIVHINEVPTEARINFLKTLNSVLPKELKDHARTMFTVTGADACEAAISLARHVSGKKTIVAFGGSYHGVAGDIVGATANYHYRDYAGISPRDIYHLPFPYPYRFPVNVPEGDISKVVIEQLEYIIRDPAAGPGSIGGVLVEPVQGEGGYIVPPDDFLPMLREVTEKYSIPLIFDEVQSGMGRTGKIWASEHYNVSPDIMCISKSVGGGIPASMISYRADYDRDLPAGFHLGTYRANPLALAAGTAILNYLKTSGILDRVTSKGRYIKKRFEEMAGKNPFIGDVRGLGYMIAAELVRDKNTREPATEIANAMKETLFRHGLLMLTCGHYGNVMRYIAPLTIEDHIIESGLDVFSESLDEVSKKMK